MLSNILTVIKLTLISKIQTDRQTNRHTTINWWTCLQYAVQQVPA